MNFSMIGRGTRGLLLAGFAFGLSACQSGKSDTGESMSPQDAAQPKTQITQADLEAFCPPVTIRQGTAAYSSYARGGNGDPTKLSYQASVSQATRSCSRADGTMTITVVAAGRIVPGPAGAPASVTLPIRVAVTRGDEVLYSQMIKDAVSVGSANSATQFLVKDANVVIPIPDRPNVQVQVGFDDANAAASQ